jgi:hypothetical protein
MWYRDILRKDIIGSSTPWRLLFSAANACKPVLGRRPSTPLPRQTGYLRVVRRSYAACQIKLRHALKVGCSEFTYITERFHLTLTSNEIVDKWHDGRHT